MARGIIYVMTTVVPGLIKIGKSGTSNFEQRMYTLESNGYKNVAGLKRAFAIEVDGYDEKEELIHAIFSKSQVGQTELFSLDLNMVIQLLSAFEGTQIYPQNASKSEVFETASDQRGISTIPDGLYYLKRKIKAWGNREVNGTLKVENGKFRVLAGSTVCPILNKGLTTISLVNSKRKEANIENDVSTRDVVFNSPSLASMFVIYGPSNGWTDWKTKDGKPIDIYRK